MSWPLLCRMLSECKPSDLIMSLLGAATLQ